MPIPVKKTSSSDSLATISNVLLSAFIICALFFGREILVPLALAALLTFMLAPMATCLQRWLGRIGSVLLVVAMVVVATVGAGWVLTSQAVDLANQLPDYKVNIQKKLRSLHVPQGGQMKKITETLEELKKDLPGEEGSLLKSPDAIQSEKHATPVAVVNGKDGRLEFMQVILTPVLGPLGTALLVLLLLVFMLLQREDLGNRLIRLIGQGRIGATTRAMDDAGNRVSKYLRMQLVVNVTFGIPVAIGLYFIGIPNAILWGALATVLRFIPYIGPWIAAAFPIVISLAVSPDWIAPLLTVGLFVVIELISNNVMEPWLYGSSTGVSPIALIVAALFWTLLWGPVGLVLATPLTVCLVVMGRHVPKLSFLSIILSDEEPLTPAEECYHRLHRTGGHGEMELVEVYLKSNPPASLFDEVLIPVITAAESDHRAGLLETEQLATIKQGLGAVMEDLEIHFDSASEVPVSGFLVCCVPAKADRDEMAGEMLARLLRQQGIEASNASATMVTGEIVGWVRESQPDIICISVVSPSTLIHARYLCSKLRKECPRVKIIVGLWGRGDESGEAILPLKESGADRIFHSVTAACDWVVANAPATVAPTRAK